MKSKMPDEEEIVLCDNLEQLLFEINEFCAPCNSKQNEIPTPLENYLKYVAKTGDTVFPWQHVRPLFRIKMLAAINNFSGEISANESFVIERFDLFRAAPFTIQRFAELVTQPNRHYKLKEKFLRGLEKTVLVVTTVQPKSCSSSGSHSSGESIDNEEEDSSTDDTMVWTSHSSDGDTGVMPMGIATSMPPTGTGTGTVAVNKTHVTNTNEETGATELSSTLSASSVQPVVTSELSLHQVVTTTTGNTTTHHPVEAHDDQGLTLLEQHTNGANEVLVPATISVPDTISESEIGISDTLMPTTIADAVAIDVTSPEAEPKVNAITTNISTIEPPVLDVDVDLQIEPSLTSTVAPTEEIPPVSTVPLPVETLNEDLIVPSEPSLSVSVDKVPKEQQAPPAVQEVATEASVAGISDIHIDSGSGTKGSDLLATEPEQKKPKIDIEPELTSTNTENEKPVEKPVAEKTDTVLDPVSMEEEYPSLPAVAALPEVHYTPTGVTVEPQLQQEEAKEELPVQIPAVPVPVVAPAEVSEPAVQVQDQDQEPMEQDVPEETPSSSAEEISQGSSSDPMEASTVEVAANDNVSSLSSGVVTELIAEVVGSKNDTPVPVPVPVPASVDSPSQGDADSAPVVDTTTSESES